MKHFTLYSILTFSLLFGSRTVTYAQTTLSAGDIAIVRMNEDSPSDGFSFVVLVPISSGTIIYFTEEGWGNSAWGGTTESHLKYTATSSLSAGSVVHVDETTTTDVFTVSGAGGSISFAWSTTNFNLSGGDQILAYQTSESSKPASPTFIAGLTLNDGNSYNDEPNDPSTGWTSVSAPKYTVNSCRLPSGLTNGATCISVFPDYNVLTEKDNARYNCTLINGTKSALLAAINNHDNWLYDNDYNYASSSVCSFTVTAVVAPTVTSTAASSITATSATLGGEVTADGGAAVTERGVTYSSTDATPTIGEAGVTKVAYATGGTGSYSQSVSALSQGTTYYFRAYAINYEGTSYGSVGSFTTLAPEINIEGNGTSIADGDATPDPNDHTDFGSASTCVATVVRTFTIRNTGSVDLTISSVNISGANADDFSVTLSPAATITPTNTTIFQVTFNPSAPGTRTATVTVNNNDSNEAAYDFSVQGTGTDLSVTALSQTNVSCNLGSNGAATVNVASGGTGPYTYDWTPGNPTGDGTTSVTGLSAGLWTCTVTDANGCTASRSFTVTQPTALSLTAVLQTNVSCNGGSNGAASVNAATGGAGGYTYNWTPGNPTGDGTTSVTGLPAGLWTCTVTDANGCTASRNFTVTQPTVLSLTAASQTNVSVSGGANGAASVNAATGGAGGYTYNWTPGNPTGDGTTSVTGLSAGSWTCTVTDANGCTTSQNFTILAPPTLTTATASSVTTTAATLGGTITNDGGDAVSARGVVYSSADATPTIGEIGVTQDTNGSGSGLFSESIGSLSLATRYYYQAYAINNAGTTYGGVQEFTTQNTITSIVRDGVSLTNATTVSWTITFAASATGLTSSNFALANTGLSSPSITNVSGSGTTWTVTANTGTGSGTLGLNIANSTGLNAEMSNVLPFAGEVYTIDKTPPTLSSSSPVDNAVTTYLGQDIVLTFNENIAKGTGNITLRKSTDNSVFEQIDVTDPKITVSGSQVTINPDAPFVRGTSYYLEIDATALKDNAENLFAGIAGSTTLNFTTVDVIINEVVTAPRSDWSTNNFNGVIGAGAVTDYDEWIELLVNTTGVNLTGWTIELMDGSNIIGNLSALGAFVSSVYFGSGSFTNTNSGDYLVLGRGNGSPMNNSITINLKDPTGTTVNTVTFSSNPSSSSDNQYDESAQRFPNGADTNTAGDWTLGQASMGAANTGPSVTISVNNATIAENAGAAIVTATLCAKSSQNTTVSLDVNVLSTATSASDYTLSSGSIVIPAGSTTGTATITSIQDATDEENETIIIDIASVTNGTEAGTQQQTVTITDDDDPPLVTLSVSPSSIAENDTPETSTITATLSAISAKIVTVTITPTSASAVLGTDYSLASTTITINPGSLTGTTSLSSIQDTDVEGHQTINIDITGVTNGTESGTQQKTIQLLDDDLPKVTLSQSASSFAEAAGTNTITATLDNTFSEDAVITIGVNASSTAIGGDVDYSLSSTTITVLAGNLSGTATITAVSDALDEFDETVVVDIISCTNSIENGVQQVTSTITDDDAAPTVSFSSATQASVDESGTMNITAQLSAVSGKDISIPFSINASSTATGSGTDYSITASPLSISAGSSSATITITIANDALDEFDETVIVDMGMPTNAIQGTTLSHTATITDDDATPMVSFTSVSQSSLDESDAMTITAQLSAPSGKNILIPFTVNGASTATGSGIDYSITASPLSISAGSTSATITITIANDVLNEFNETVIVDMGMPTNAMQGTTLSHTATITDDDATPTVSFTSVSQTSVDESDAMTITAQLSAVSGKNILVPFTVNGASTATGSGTDYSITASPLSISAGSTSATITITIANDALDEFNETVIVDMGMPTNAMQGTTLSHTATITDDDATPTVSFTSVSQASVDESGTMTITAQLSAVSGKNILVPFTVNGASTATGSGTDYSITASPLSISAGSTSATITITIANDALDEFNETVIVDMGTPTNAMQGTTLSHTATITDDDDAPMVTLTASPSNIAENSESSTITATISAVSAKTVTVNLGFSGTATGGGVDYSLSSSSITIAAGSLNGTAVVTSVQEVVSEGNETIIVDISSVTNAIEDGVQQQTITIVDDDLPVASLSQSVNSFSEAGGTNTITVSLSNVFSSDVTVTIGASILCTAEINTDFTLSPTTIVIAAGNTSGTATITALQDLADESDESVIVDIVSCVNAFENGVQQVTSLIVDDDVLPSLTTDAVTVIGNTTASLGGNITDSGTQAVTERGVVFSSTNATPMLDWIGVTSDSNGSGTGAFSELIGSLLPHKVYYVQAYATSAVGTAYGGVQTFTTTYPEINVKGNGQTIADGDATPSTADYTDLGSVFAASGTIVKTFTIENTGNGTLTLGANAVTFSGTNATDFTVSSAPSVTIAAGASTTFDVTFDPGAKGARTASLVIANDDSDENPYNFGIQGTGLNSAPTVSGLVSDVTVKEDILSNIDLSAATFADADGDALTVTITASAGTISSVLSGAVTVNGSGTAVLTLSGTAANINTFLDTPSNIQYVGVWNQNGDNAASLAMNVNDGAVNPLLGSVNIDITAQNDDPVMTGLPTDITVLEDVAGNVDLSSATFSDVDAGVGTVSITLLVGEGTLTALSGAGVTISGSGTSGLTLSGTVANIDAYLNTASNIKYTGALDASGDNVTTLRLNADDNGNTGEGGGGSVLLGTVNIDITAVNDKPSFTIGSNKTVAQNAGAQSYVGFIANISDGDAEVTQAVSFHVSNSNTALFTTQPAISADGTLTFSLDATKFGKSIVTVYATDDGGTANGGTNQSLNQTFKLFVTPVGISINELNTYASTSEFIELYNNNGSIMNLDGLVVVFFNGDAVNDAVYKSSIDLDGYSLSAKDFFVIGDDGVANLDMSLGATDIQDGTDAVALFVGDQSDFTVGTAATSDGLVDAVVYGSSDDATLRSILGNVSLINENANEQRATESISRWPDGIGNLGAQAATPGVTNDVIAPTVVSVSSSNIDNTYKTGDLIAVTITFSESVVVTGTPILLLNSGGTALYVSGTGTTNLTFNYTVATGNSSADLDYSATTSLSFSGGSIKDIAGNTATLTLPAVGGLNSLGGQKNIVVDGILPTVLAVSSTSANSVYGIGTSVSVTITFSEPMTVTGTPVLSLNSGGIATYVSTNASVLTFNYVVSTGNSSSDLDYLATNSLSLAGGTINDLAGNNASLTLPAVGSANSLGGQKNIVVDGVVPTVSYVTSQKANGTYGIGELINIEVVFSENMVVTGTPQLVLETGVVDRVVNYASGSGSNTLIFAYTTLCGDESADLDYKATDALPLNSGTIKDVAGNNAVLTLASPGTANSLGTNKAIVVEAFPSVSLSVGSVSISENGGTTTITASLSEVSTQNVVVSLLYSGTAIRGADYNSNVSSTITIPAGSLSANASVGLATIQDVDAEGNETVIVDISSVLKGVESATQQQTITIVDDDLPTVTSIAVPANGFYKAGQTLDFVATFNQAVIINTQAGVPSIPLTIGADLKQAALVGGVNGSNTATFRYTVLVGDEDKDGIQLGNSIELNGATIRNAEGLNAALLLYGVGNTSGLNVDAIVPNAPVIVSISTDTNTSGDGITNDSSLSIDGTAEANTSVELFIDAVSIGTTSVNSSGTWIFDHSSVNLSTGTYSVTAQVTDAAGNVSSLSAGFTIVVDLLAPTVVISADHVNLTNTALTVTFTFNEAVQNFASSDITVTNALVSNFAANSASVYSCIVTPIAEGTVTIDVAANVANDVAGNGNQAASTYSITYDQTSPTVIVSSVAANPTNAAIDAVITFSEPVSGFDLNDIIVVNGRLESLTDVNGSVYSISIIPAIDGIVTVRVPSVVAIDVAGNTNQESNVYSFVCDRTQPEVTITQTGINNAARSFTAEFNFTESITGFAASDIVLSGGVVNKFTALTTQKYSVEITKTTTAVVEMSLPESAVFDVANNPNKAGSLSVEFDYTPPTVHCRDTVLYLDENGAAVITAQEMDNHSSDEFGIAKRELNVSSFTCTQLGENKVVLTVTDNSGNTAFCEAKVTVKDRIVVLTKDISVLLNDKGEVTISPEQVNNGSFNSCGGLTYELDKTDFTCANMGENTVVLTAINAQGELATETATVTVRAINHQPSFTSLPDVTIAEDTNYILVPVSGVVTGDCTGSAQKVISMTAAFMSDLVERVEVAYTPGAESGMVKAYFKKNVFGTADIYVTIIDDGGTAEDGVNSYTSGFSVHILSQNDAPSAVRTVDPQMVTVGSSFSYQIPSDLFVDPDEGDAISYSVAAKSGSFPAWLKYDQAEQRLYGTPSSTDVGNLFVRLIATDQTGASGNTFVEIIVYQNSFSSITGSVYEKSTLLNGGAMVNLYELVSTNPKPTYKYITRTTVSQAGNFGFYNLTAGDYIVEASVVDTVRYNSMMTTYYEKSIGWENAKVITLDGNSNKHIDMVMLEKPVRTTGVYRIFGVIIAKTGDQQKSGLILKGTAEDSGNPLEGITIHLKQNNQIIETTQTDENGYYEFASLPEGLYQIEVVYPGFEQQEAIVVEKTEEQPKEDPVNFTVWEGIQVITDVDEIRVKLNVSMFPNPTHGELTVRLNTLASEKVDIQVFSVSGQLVYQQSFLPSYEYSIDLSNQYPGVYLVQVKTGLQNAIERIVIK